ncbi:UNKNOWN [Stylonychia lemnae]|uniref:Transmembrane protein n=1 Tax=Stylonychia lemnae TaxID=5949 RepID=A0A077ZT15_STYLE|nr:UNKNOWN [Stylonychia lemnae]|eukprot:CDW73028.1 UNKNOWN [Stylonychia lemnae]
MKRNILKHLKVLIRSLDLFGTPIKLTFKNKSTYTSLFGGFVSLIMMIWYLYLVISSFISMVNRDFHSISKSVDIRNQAVDKRAVTLTSQNFDVGAQVLNLNQTEVDAYEYVSLSLVNTFFFYDGQNLTYNETLDYLTIFAGNYFCPSSNYSVEIVGQMVSKISKTMSIRVGVCTQDWLKIIYGANTTKKCKTPLETIQNLQYLALNSILTQQNFDESDFENPIKNHLKVDFFQLSSVTGQWFVSKITQNFAILSDSYVYQDVLGELGGQFTIVFGVVSVLIKNFEEFMFFKKLLKSLYLIDKNWIQMRGVKQDKDNKNNNKDKVQDDLKDQNQMREWDFSTQNHDLHRLKFKDNLNGINRESVCKKMLMNSGQSSTEALLTPVQPQIIKKEAILYVSAIAVIVLSLELLFGQGGNQVILQSKNKISMVEYSKVLDIPGSNFVNVFVDNDSAKGLSFKLGENKEITLKLRAYNHEDDTWQDEIVQSVITVLKVNANGKRVTITHEGDLIVESTNGFQYVVSGVQDAALDSKGKVFAIVTKDLVEFENKFESEKNGVQLYSNKDYRSIEVYQDRAVLVKVDGSLEGFSQLCVKEISVGSKYEEGLFALSCWSDPQLNLFQLLRWSDSLNDWEKVDNVFADKIAAESYTKIYIQGYYSISELTLID